MVLADNFEHEFESGLVGLANDVLPLNSAAAKARTFENSGRIS